MLLDESRAQVSGPKVRAVQDRAVVWNRRRGSDPHELTERAACASDSLRPIAAVDDQLGDERVIVRRHVGARTESGIDTDTGARRSNPSRDSPGVWNELAQRIFPVDAHLGRKSFPFGVPLPEAQLDARPHSD